jgi:molecular chaperone Hsp33
VSDSLLTLEAPQSGLRLELCSAPGVARSASARHGLAAGSAAALAQGLTAALLLAGHQRTRVDVQLECNGPLRGLLVDADESGAVRGLVRAKDLEVEPRSEQPSRFDGRPLLASPHDERAGALSVMCAPAGGLSAHRAAFPFAGADLGAALTLFLRSDREEGGEMALEVLLSAGEPLLAVAGVLVSPLQAEDAEKARVLGKPLRQGGLAAALGSGGEARQIADALARTFDLGPLRAVAGSEPRFACRCSRERVARALRSLGATQLRELADKDRGASLTCDFCNAAYRFSASELIGLSQP